jgi:hypothetical protein
MIEAFAGSACRKVDTEGVECFIEFTSNNKS